MNLGARAVAALLVLNTALGVMVNLRGATVPGLLAYFGTDARGIGLLFAWVTVGGTLAVLIGGWLSDGLGSRPVAALGLAISVLCFALFGRTRSLALAQAQLLGMGLGSGLVQAGSIAACARVGGSRAQALMNVSQAFYGLGAVLGPLLVAAVLAAGSSWQAAYRATAVIAAACIAAAVLLSPAPAHTAAGEAVVRPLSVLARGLLWAMALLGTLCVTLEAGIGEWTSEFSLQRFRSSPAAAAVVVSLYWVGIAGGRLIASRLVHRLPPGQVIAAAALLLPPLVLASIVNPWAGAQYALAAAAGLALGPVFATLLGWAGGLSARSAGIVTGFLAAVSIGGASILRPAMTVVSAWRGLSAGFLFFLGLSLVMAAVAVALARRPAVS